MGGRRAECDPDRARVHQALHRRRRGSSRPPVRGGRPARVAPPAVVGVPSGRGDRPAPGCRPGLAAGRGGPEAAGRWRPDRPRASRPWPPAGLRRPVPVLPDPAGRQLAGRGTPGSGRRTGGTAGSSGSPRSRSRRAPGAAGRWRLAVAGVDQDLGDEVVVLGRDPVAGLDRRCRPGRPGPAGITHRRTRPGVGVKSRAGSSAAMRTSIAWPAGRRPRSAAASASSRQRPPGGEPELLADDVEAGDELGHAVLDLEPGVDLEEVERAVRGAEELGRRGVPEAGRRGDPDGHARAGRGARRRSGRAPAPPRRASGGGAGASSRAPRSRRPGPSRRRAAGPRCGGPGRSPARGRPTRHRMPTRPRADPPASAAGSSAARRDPAHAPAATAGRRLDQQREADPLGLGDDRGDLVGPVDRRRLERSRDRRDPDRSRAVRRAWSLSPSASIDVRRRPDEDEPGLLDRPGEGRPLGQEAVAGMDGLGTRGQGRLDDRVDPQVALGGRRRTDPDGHVGQADVHAPRRRRRCRPRPPPCPARGRPG